MMRKEWEPYYEIVMKYLLENCRDDYEIERLSVYGLFTDEEKELINKTDANYYVYWFFSYAKELLDNVLFENRLVSEYFYQLSRKRNNIYDALDDYIGGIGYTLKEKTEYTAKSVIDKIDYIMSFISKIINRKYSR